MSGLYFAECLVHLHLARLNPFHFILEVFTVLLVRKGQSKAKINRSSVQMFKCLCVSRNRSFVCYEWLFKMKKTEKKITKQQPLSQPQTWLLNMHFMCGDIFVIMTFKCYHNKLCVAGALSKRCGEQCCC